MSIGRPSVIDKTVFDMKFQAAYDEYRQLFLGPAITSEMLKKIIAKHGLHRGGKLINHKQWSDMLSKLRLDSQKTYLKNCILEQFTKLQNNGLDRPLIIKAIAEKLNRKESSINATLRLAGHGLKAKQRKSTKRDGEKVEQHFKAGRSVREIANLVSISQAKVLFHLRSSGYSTDEINYTHNAIFEYRDLTELNLVNAHLLGLIWADGSISNGKNLTIRLNCKDHDYLTKIAAGLVINGSKPPMVNHIQNKDDYARYSKEDAVGVSICRRNYVRYLNDELGMPSNKEAINHGLPSCILAAENPIFFAFLRGFFEGDGHITENKHHPSLGFSCTSKIADELKKELSERLHLSVQKVLDKGDTYTASIAGRSPVFLLLLHLYRSHEKTVVMQRKFERAGEIWTEFARTNFTESMITMEGATRSDDFFNICNLFWKDLKNLDIRYIFFNISNLEVICDNKRAFSKRTNIPMRYVTRVTNGLRKSTSQWFCLGRHMGDKRNDQIALYS